MVRLVYSNGKGSGVFDLAGVRIDMRAQLIPLDGGEPIDLVKDLILVGRKDDCDVRLNHKSVSKLHCVIVKTEGMLLVRDLGSTNGTRVNNKRVRRAALLSDSQLTIATFAFRVQLGPGETPVSPDQQTQQMDAKDVANLLRKINPKPPLDDDDEPLDSRPVQPNILPDHYPEED